MERIRKALLGGHPLIYVLSWEESRVERLAQHLAKTFYGAPCPYGVWSVVDGLVVDGAPVPGHAGPAQGPRGDPRGSGEGLLPAQGLSDRRPPRDRAAPARPLPRPQGPGTPRPSRLAAPGDPGGGEEGDLRRRVRAAGRQRDPEDPRRPPAPAAEPLDLRARHAPARARHARPDGRRDRPRRRRRSSPRARRSTRRPSSRSSPRRSRCPGRRACSSSSRRASRSTTSAATRP